MTDAVHDDAADPSEAPRGGHVGDSLSVAEHTPQCRGAPVAQQCTFTTPKYGSKPAAARWEGIRPNGVHTSMHLTQPLRLHLASDRVSAHTELKQLGK